MVRFKNRYLTFQLDRQSDLVAASGSVKRFHCSPKPLVLDEGQLASSIKGLVEELHGDFGRASVTVGLKTVYCNCDTRLFVVRVRHGPHVIVASVLPFLSKVARHDKLVPRLIYTGATLRSCYKRMAEYQKAELQSALLEADDHQQQSLLDEIRDTGNQ